MDEATEFAAIVGADRRLADLLLADFTAHLRATGRAVHGLIQLRPPSGKGGTVLLDLQTGERYPLFQDLGAGSQSCSVDTNILAAASRSLRRALDARADLAVVNRFGPLEAAGGGLLSEMLTLIAEGVPVLTIVRDDCLPAWRHVTGNRGAELPATRAALDSWFANLKRS
jgi:nucleoside-triphosphatase THEP1